MNYKNLTLEDLDDLAQKDARAWTRFRRLWFGMTLAFAPFVRRAFAGLVFVTALVVP